MTTTLSLGNTVAPDADLQNAPAAPTTLAELLALIKIKNDPHGDMIRSVATRFLECANATADSVSIDTVYRRKDVFIAYLRAGKYKKSSVKSYRNYLNMLFRRAEDAGWICPDKIIPPEWEAIARALPKRMVKHIVRYAIRIGRTPQTLCEEDLKAWIRKKVEAGSPLTTAEDICCRFRLAIARAALSASFPSLRPRVEYYGVSISNMHADLRREVEALVDWKTSEFQVDRPSGTTHIREISAEHMTDAICQLTGYLQNIERRPEITSMSELFTKDNVSRFVMWAKNKRKVKGQSIASRLAILSAALKQNPHYEELDLDWFPNIIRQLPKDSRSKIDQRKAQKYIEYSDAEQIPNKIRSERLNARNLDPYTLAIYARNELIMLWLVIWPWRQKNLRDCWILGSTPNLFKAPIRRLCMATKPSWVAELERTTPGTSFWQVHFDKEETKTKNDVDAFFPSELVPLLEEYLSKHRPVLLGDYADPGTLFFSNRGKPFSAGQFSDIVRNLAAKYTGVPTTPHLFRDIVAYEWLRTHPEDYLTVSKLLWHRNINTTLLIYGSRFDESTGIARVDDWRASRRKNSAQ